MAPAYVRHERIWQRRSQGYVYSRVGQQTILFQSDWKQICVEPKAVDDEVNQNYIFAFATKT